MSTDDLYGSVRVFTALMDPAPVAQQHSKTELAGEQEKVSVLLRQSCTLMLGR
jgi:hypothetical protein